MNLLIRASLLVAVAASFDSAFGARSNQGMLNDVDASEPKTYEELRPGQTALASPDDFCSRGSFEKFLLVKRTIARDRTKEVSIGTVFLREFGVIVSVHKDKNIEAKNSAEEFALQFTHAQSFEWRISTVCEAGVATVPVLGFSLEGTTMIEEGGGKEIVFPNVTK